MKEDFIFRECQLKKPWWIWILMIGFDILFIAGVIWQVVLGHKFGNNPMSNPMLIIVAVFFLVLSIFTLSSKLETAIDKEGIYYRYFPFNLRFKFVPWNDILECGIIQYRPVRNYGGYGIRLSRRGKAYIVFGNFGLQIIFKNGKRLLIGTQQPEEMQEALDKFMKTDKN